MTRRFAASFAGVARALACCCLVFMLASCMPMCSPTAEEGAERVRSLDQATLAALYRDMQVEHRRLQPYEIVEWGVGLAAMPEPFVRAGAFHGDVGHLDRLIFGGCMDDKAWLRFEGLDEKGPARITLYPGELHSSEVIWEPTDKPRAE